MERSLNVVTKLHTARGGGAAPALEAGYSVLVWRRVARERLCADTVSCRSATAHAAGENTGRCTFCAERLYGPASCRRYRVCHGSPGTVWLRSLDLVAKAVCRGAAPGPVGGTERHGSRTHIHGSSRGRGGDNDHRGARRVSTRSGGCAPEARTDRSGLFHQECHAEWQSHASIAPAVNVPPARHDAMARCFTQCSPPEK